MNEDTSSGALDVTLPNSSRGQKLFGRYVLVKVLGRGGMGIVWLARDEELERDVALKFLPEMIVHDRALINELKRETRRSLELTHKNIVRIHDFVNDDKTACISMEYVDGDTLSNLRADKEHQVFEPHEIAGWTAQLCDGLDYAHNHARIIHRDLKPANLMVNRNGELKISDFGIARRLGDSVSRVTNVGGTSGTLIYMSPQQLDGEHGTHLDDIYSLGATLYDLLTSKPPFYSGNIDMQIHERVAPSMTERRKDLNIEPALVPASWEQVVAACLDKDPARRPQSTAEVASRLKLASLRTRRPAPAPVLIRRLSRRAVTALALGTIMVGIVGTVIWQLRNQAEMKAEIAKLRQGIAGFPQTEAEVRESHNETNPAAVQEQVYTSLAKQLGLDPKMLRERLPQVAAELSEASNATTYERANARYVSKHYFGAEQLALQTADETRKREPTNSRKILQALELAGLSAQKQIQYARAMDHFREAENLTDRNSNLEDWVRLQHEIAGLLVAQGKYGDAEKLFRSVIEARTKMLGPERPDTLDSRHRLVYVLSRQSRYAEAEAEAREVLKLREKVLGPEHLDTVVSRYDVAEPLVAQGKYAEAESLYRDVIRLNEKVLGKEHPRTLAGRVGLATVLGSQGKNAEAEPLYREIITSDERLYGPENPQTLNDRQNLATALHADGKYAEAEEQYRQVIKIDQKLVGPEHPDTLVCRNNLAEMLDDQGKYSEAETECRQIVAVETRVVGPENELTLNTRGNLAVALIGQGKFPEAETEYREVMRLMERVFGLEHPDTLGFASKFSAGLARQSRQQEARALARQLSEKSREVLGADNPATARYSKLAEDLEAQSP